MRGTYLFDREAGRLLASCPMNSADNNDGLGHLMMEEEGDGGDLLDHFGGVVDGFLLRNLVVGKDSNTPHWARTR